MAPYTITPAVGVVCRFQFPRARHPSKRRRRWVGVKGSTRNGRRDPKCPSTRRLRMIREDTGAPSEGATCARMAAHETVGCTRAFLKCGGLLDDWSVEGVLSLVFVSGLQTSYCVWMRQKISEGFTPSANKKRITVLFSLVQIDKGAAMLNGLLHPNDYEERRVTHCIEALLTTPHSALDTSTVAKHWKEKFQSCQVIYSQFGLAIHQNDHQARRRFVEWVQNEIGVVPDFHKRVLFSDEAHFWLNGYVNKQNCRIWSEANPQVYVETPLHPEKLTVWCALWTGGILLQKR
ncbi:uncharacterized protein TNCV_1436321 [Trichonephila clavipes]|nr:uncharacterized protein TNCV_1436321 [Trichonephila clavipes]